MTLKEITRIAEPWIRLLGLEHWKIEWKYGGLGREQEARALLWFDAGYHEARISVADDWNVDWGVLPPVDIESVIVHELLELLFADFRQMTWEKPEEMAHYLAAKFEKLLMDVKNATFPPVTPANAPKPPA